MSAPSKKLKMTTSQKDDWFDSSWYFNNAKDVCGQYHLDLPI